MQTQAALAPTTTGTDDEPRLEVAMLARAGGGATLADDVRAGFAAVPRWLPPKYFYDARGAHLFDLICDTPEYYLTRTEQALLDEVAGEVVAICRPDDLVELGSGAARKTRTLLDALAAQRVAARYVPVDLSQEMMVRSAEGLLADYPWLRVRAIVADYERQLDGLPRSGRRLVAFLGSSLGNFDPTESVAFLSRVAAALAPGDHLLLGLDRVKAPATLVAAYDDAAGITAEFNRNVLHVINRELGADFDATAFEHVARYVPEQAQIEMHLRARAPQVVHVPGVRRTYRFAAGEMLRTEISRKWTADAAFAMMAAAGLRVVRWFSSPGEQFSLALAARAA